MSVCKLYTAISLYICTVLGCDVIVHISSWSHLRYCSLHHCIPRSTFNNAMAEVACKAVLYHIKQYIHAGHTELIHTAMQVFVCTHPNIKGCMHGALLSLR